MATGFALYTVGDGLWWREWLSPPPAFPAPAEPFFLVGYALFGVGLAWLIRRRRTEGGAGTTLAVTAGAGLVSWLFLIGPFTRIEGLTLVQRKIDVEITLWRTVRTDRPGYAAFIRDISELKRFEEQLRHQALHDPPTGLPNRGCSTTGSAGSSPAVRATEGPSQSC